MIYFSKVTSYLLIVISFVECNSSPFASCNIHIQIHNRCFFNSSPIHKTELLYFGWILLNFHLPVLLHLSLPELILVFLYLSPLCHPVHNQSSTLYQFHHILLLLLLLYFFIFAQHIRVNLRTKRVLSVFIFLFNRIQFVLDNLSLFHFICPPIQPVMHILLLKRSNVRWFSFQFTIFTPYLVDLLRCTFRAWQEYPVTQQHHSPSANKSADI